MRRQDPRACPAVYHAEFLAGNQLVKINPKFESQQPLRFVSGTFGPFKPHRPAVVPLWLALDLKRRNLCDVYPPDWLTTTQLQRYLDLERTENSEFVPLPYHFLEIGKMLADAYPDYLKGSEEVSDEVRSLLLAIDIHRDEKVRQGLQALKTYVPGIKLANLISMEVHTLRPILAALFDTLRFLGHPGDPLDQPRAADPSQPSSAELPDSGPTGALSQTTRPAESPAGGGVADSPIPDTLPAVLAPTKKRRTLRDPI